MKISLSVKEKHLEEERLNHTIEVLKNRMDDLGEEIFHKEEKSTEFKKYMWESKEEFDDKELQSLMISSEQEAYNLEVKSNYYKKLYKIKNNPYFGSIIFNEDNNSLENIYIGITHLEDKDDKHLIYDWRSPICSLFYDYELGKCQYECPGGIIKGELVRKRQYKIEDSKLKNIFDTSVNIDDDLLQEVLASESSDKMKNIVNTIQQEQNKIIRNVEDRNLFVQGIAGSGKTSVALHRIAFLLYKIKNLSSKNVLVFSPNQVFTEYISNVLPELGEENTMQTTFNEFLNTKIKEYKKVESFVDFIARYYKYQESNPLLVKYKQSDEIINDIDKYLEEIVRNTKFLNDITLDKVYDYTKDELNDLLHRKYDKYPLINRIEEIATKLSYDNNKGGRGKISVYRKILKENLNLKLDLKAIYAAFFKSKYSKIKMSDVEINKLLNNKTINYEDALLFVYVKGILEGFDYDKVIEQIVVDEAQDYSRLQYLILSKIFNKAGYTILGDINQTINPYYKYTSLETLQDLFKGNSKYLELTKTYRSSEEIIEYTNKILNLSYVSAIRKENNKPVLLRTEDNLKEQLCEDIKLLKKDYKSIAIITKDDDEASYVYKKIKDDFSVTLVDNNTTEFIKELIIIPSYIAKGLEFDSVIVYNKKDNKYNENEKYLYYVACTRAQHQMIIYN